MPSKTVMVTGASGFVGRYLCTMIQAAGHQVMAYSLRYGQDVRDYDQLRSFVAMAQPDEIHHLAAQAYVPETATNPGRGYDINVRGTVNLLEAVRQTGSRARIHLAGTSEEYGYVHPGFVDLLTEDVLPQPQSPYGASKLAAGSVGLVYAARYGMPVVVTRAFNHTGPGQSAQYAVASFTRQIAMVAGGHAPSVRVGNLEARRDYMDVRDVCNGYRKAIKLDPGVYNMCSLDPPRTMGEILLMASATVEPSVELKIEQDEGLYRPMTTQGETIMPRPDSSRFRLATGWEQQFTLEETLADMVRYWEEQL